jgi:hypothetical protein
MPLPDGGEKGKTIALLENRGRRFDFIECCFVNDLTT